MGQYDRIFQIVASSEIVGYRWKSRGRAPIGFYKGMAVSFSSMYCRLLSNDEVALEIAKKQSGDLRKDALAYYNDKFAEIGLTNDTDGKDTLRHLYVLLFGLGMRESSGRYCEGRDQSAENTTAETAEAGLFQTSYNARRASPLLEQVFRKYLSEPNQLADIFGEGNIRCSAADWENFGSGDGKEFQRLSKESPAFAVEFAAVALRNIRTHWGPINRKNAELRPECDSMLVAIQQFIDENGYCTQ